MSAVRFRDATVADVPTITALQNAAADALTARMNAAFESMERDGTLQQILHRYDTSGTPAQR